ncbi:Crossover junction endonuclease mus81 [Quaeritorhiza haematococci]|nr:Crossover junction endonuclease mus81 [Quaeritorhiza haematococci]
MDIDDEILALAGDEPPSRTNKRKRDNGKRGSSSSEESESDFDESSEDDYDDDEDEGEDEDNENSELKEVQTWGDNLIGDDEDRRRLEAMTEVERETVLMERAEKRQRVLDRLKILNKLNEGKGTKKLEKGSKKSDDRRTSTRQSNEREKKSKSLSALKDKREKRRKKSVDYEDTRKKRTRAAYSSPSESEEGEVEEEDVRDREERPQKKDEDHPTAAEPLKREDLIAIQVTRDELEKWCHAGFFKNTVTGCFVRLGIGLDPATKQRVYRIAQITEVVEYHRAYRFGQTLTKKALDLAHATARKVFLMDITSNSPFTDSEWSRFEQTMQVEKVPMPTMDHVKRKQEDLKTAREHIFTNEEIDAMIQEKRTLIKVPTNIAAEKVRIMQDRTLAEQSGDKELLEQLSQRLFELDELSKDMRRGAEERLEMLAKLNERNRLINIKETREAERIANELKKMKREGSSGGREGTPIANRKKLLNFGANGSGMSPSPSRARKNIPTGPIPNAAVLSNDEFIDAVDISELIAAIDEKMMGTGMGEEQLHTHDQPVDVKALFTKWLGEWWDEYKELAANGNQAAERRQWIYRKAYESIKKFPNPIRNGRDALHVHGIGKSIAESLQRKLDKHFESNGLGPQLQVGSSTATDGPSQPVAAPKGRGQGKRKRKGVDDEIGLAAAGIGRSASGSSSNSVTMNTAPPKRARKAKPYVPAYRSGGYAILVTLLQENRTSGYMTKHEIIKKAQIHCDTSLDVPEANKLGYTGWSSMKTLLEKALVFKHGLPHRFCLTDEGKALAETLLRAGAGTSAGGANVSDSAAASSSQESGFVDLDFDGSDPSDFGGEPDEDFYYSSQGSNRSATGPSRNLEDPAPSVIREEEPLSGLPFWYLDDRNQRVAYKDDAFVDIQGSDVLFKIEFPKNHQTQAFNVKVRKISSKDSMYNFGFLENEIAPNVCPKPKFESEGSRSSSSSANPVSNSATSHSKAVPSHTLARNASNGSVISTTSNASVASRGSASSSNKQVTASQLPRTTSNISIIQATARAQASGSNITASTSRPPTSITLSKQASKAKLPIPNLNWTPIHFARGSFEVLLVLDMREIKQRTDRDFFQRALRERGVSCDTRSLELGDVTWVARRKNGPADEEIMLGYIIERKTMNDLICSIKDGRYDEQKVSEPYTVRLAIVEFGNMDLRISDSFLLITIKFRLANCGLENIIYLLEETTNADAEGFSAAAIRSALAGPQVLSGFNVKRSKTIDESVHFLVTVTNMLRRKFEGSDLYAIPPAVLDKDKFKHYLSEASARHGRTYRLTFTTFGELNSKRGCFTVHDVWIRQLMTIRGVSAEKAVSIVTSYPTPRSLKEALDALPTREEKEALLTGLGEVGRKAIIPALAKRMVDLFCSDRY